MDEKTAQTIDILERLSALLTDIADKMPLVHVINAQTYDRQSKAGIHISESADVIKIAKAYDARSLYIDYHRDGEHVTLGTIIDDINVYAICHVNEKLVLDAYRDEETMTRYEQAISEQVKLFEQFRRYEIFNEPHGDLELLYKVEQVLIKYGHLDKQGEEFSPWNT